MGICSNNMKTKNREKCNEKININQKTNLTTNQNLGCENMGLSNKTTEKQSFVKPQLFADSKQGAKLFQEDSFFTFLSSDYEIYAAGCFDGHGGKNGAIASKCAEKQTLLYLEKNWALCNIWDDAKWAKEMEQLFCHIHESIRQEFINILSNKNNERDSSTEIKIDEYGVVRKNDGFPVHGGTTGTLVIVVHQPKSNVRKVICANVGDSDAILVSNDENNDILKKYEHLSVDHGPDNKDEFLRLQQLSDDEFPSKLLFVYDIAGIYKKYECPKVFLKNGVKNPKFVNNPWNFNLRPTNVRYDPAVYAVTPKEIKTDLTCIAMTRSLGDFYGHRFGLSCIPDVKIRELDLNTDFTVCLGTDGIWDCWKFDDFSFYVNKLLKQGASIEEVVVTILNMSIKLAIRNFGCDQYDDATIAMIKIGKNYEFTNEKKDENNNKCRVNRNSFRSCEIMRS